MKGKRKRRRQRGTSRVPSARPLLPVTHGVRLEDVVVWNLDARYRPELEVELEITHPRPPKPAEVFASGTPPHGTAVLLSSVDIPFVKLEDLAAEELTDDDLIEELGAAS